MLPPHLRRASVRPSTPSLDLACRAASSTLLRRSVLSGATRSFWGRRNLDWSCSTDPGYQRFHRIRTLKTRAKLLEKIRRRGKFEWAPNQAEFFSPKSVRWASHSNRGSRTWPLEEDSPEKAKDEAASDAAEAQEDGYESSDREKLWHKRMEMVRRRIERDPYEAIFGKRFEPFWSPLVPSYMREEMGLQNWSKQRDEVEGVQDESPKHRSKPESESERPGESAASAKTNASAGPSVRITAASISHTVTSSSSDGSNHQVSESYTYDPISNRMVRVTSPKPAGSVEDNATALPFESQTQSPAQGGVPEPPNELRKSFPIPMSATASSQSSNAADHNLPGPAVSNAVSSSPSRPAILAKLPENDMDLLTADRVRASMGKTKSSSNPVRPSTSQEKAALERDFDERTRADVKPLQPALDRLQSKDQPQPVDPDDSAAHESTEPAASATIPKNWAQQADMLQTDRIRRVAGKPKYPMTRWIDDMLARKAKFEAEEEVRQTITDKANASREARAQKLNAQLQAEVAEQKLRMQAYETRYAHKISDLRSEVDTAYRQSTVHAASHLDRIQGLEKELAAARKLADDNQATVEKQGKAYKEKIKSLRGELETAYKQSVIHSEKHLERIKNLENDLSTSRKLTPSHEAAGNKTLSATDDLDSALRRIRALAQDLGKTPTGSKEDRGSESGAKARTEQSLKSMQAEGDFCPNITKFAGSSKWYKRPASTPAVQTASQEVSKADHKTPDQRLVAEVKQIYEQRYGTINADHRQNSAPSSSPTILERVQQARGAARKPTQVVEVESDVDLGEELAKYENEKQHAYDFRPDGLEKEIQTSTETKEPAGEISLYEKLENGRPYQFKAEVTPTEVQAKRDLPVQTRNEMAEYEKLEKKQAYRFKNDNLETEIKAQTQPGDEMAEYISKEKGRPYRFQPDSLASEIKAQTGPRDEMAEYLQAEKGQHYRFRPDGLEQDIKERQASSDKTVTALLDPRNEKYAAQAMQPESSMKMRKVIADTLKPTFSTSLKSATNRKVDLTPPEIQWVQPPVYRTLAYDPRVDEFSCVATAPVATAPHNTGGEIPISIQHALSQLTHPARFAPHFARLQKKGFQLIHGTEKSLVFRKAYLDGAADYSKGANGLSLADHGVAPGKAKMNARVQRETTTPSNKANVNPIDGTRASPATGNFASPTGFVNYDRVDGPTENAAVSGQAASATIEKDDRRRVRRQERHFTGTLTAPVDPAAPASATGAVDSTVETPDLDPLFNFLRRLSRLESSSERRQKIREFRIDLSGVLKQLPQLELPDDEIGGGRDEPEIRTKRQVKKDERRAQWRERERTSRRGGALWWATSVGAGSALVAFLVGTVANSTFERDGRGSDEWTRRADEARRRMELARG